MKIIKDRREYSPHLYDLNNAVDDIEFYLSQIDKKVHNILELGCGTGRVLIPLAKKGVNITGIDYSPAMITECLRKIKKQELTGKANAIMGNICDFKLDKTFDMIIASFRVIQALETIAELHNCLNCIKKHLSAGGFCILNVFNPSLSKEEMGKSWRKEGETFCWEKIDSKTGHKIIHFDERQKIDPGNQVLYPTMIYRVYDGDKLINEVRQDIVMKYYYPEEFESIIVNAGFEIQEKYGGYHGEKYGQGKELVIKFGV
ncbi:MAG: class I SAM-dependent methyltransferase [bacterium]|nr:class I SAM-dependent methyltransferase [bacterium]